MGARDITEVFSHIEKLCTALGEDIWDAVLQMKTAGTPTASPTKHEALRFMVTPSTEISAASTPSSSRPPSPTKSALRSAAYDALARNTATPRHKRAVAFSDFDAEPCTDQTPTKPWKRRKFGDNDKDGKPRFPENPSEIRMLI